MWKARLLCCVGVMALLVGGSSSAVASVFTPGGPALTTVDSPGSVAFSPNGFFAAAAASNGGPLARFELAGGKGLKPLAGSAPCSGNSLAFKPTGSVLAATNPDTNTVSLCSMSSSDGGVTLLGSPLPTGLAPTYVQFSPNGKLLVTLDSGIGTASMFRVNAATLEPVADDGYDVVFQPTSARFSPDSRFLVVTSACPIRKTIRTFAVATDGSLTSTDVRDPPVGCALDSVFEPDTKQLVVLSADRYSPYHGELTTYRITEAGTLVQVGQPVDAGTGPSRLAISPDGGFLTYVSSATDTVTLVRRDAGGALTRVASAPTGGHPSSVAFSVDGELIGVTTVDDDRVQLFRVAPGPSLLPTGAPTVLGGASSYVAALGSRVAITTYSPPGLELYALDATGGLTRTAGRDATALASPHGPALSSTGQLLAVGGGDGATSELSTFRVSDAGIPTAVATAPTGAFPAMAKFSPNDELIATANVFDNSVSLFSVSSSGALTARGTFPVAGEHPRSIAFRPDGTLLLTADENSGTVTAFPVNGTSLGAPKAIGVGGFPTVVTFRPSGTLFAEVDYSASLVKTYAIDAAGNATFVDSGAIPAARDAAFSPDGTLLVVVGEGEMHAFTVSADGHLTSFGDPTPTDLSPSGVTFAAGGDFIVASQMEGATAWVYPVGASVLDTVVSSGPAPFDRTDNPTFTFDASYPATFECRLDGNAFAPCGRSKSVTVTGSATYTLQVRAVDHFGQLDATPASYTWTRDVTPPTLSPLLTPADHATALPAGTTFSWGAATDLVAGVTAYDLIVDGNVVKHVLSSDCVIDRCTAQPPLPLSDGTHTWKVRAVDGAGNELLTSARSFTIDASPPVAARPAAPVGDAVVGTARPRLDWQPALDGGSGVASYDVIVDDAVQASGLGPESVSWTAAADLADGRHTWAVRAIDHNGNVAQSATAGFVTDHASPEARLIVHHDDPIVDPGPPFFLGEILTFDASDSTDPGGRITGYAWDLDGDGRADPGVNGAQATKSLDMKAGGQYPVVLFVTDQAGHTTTLSYTVVVDANRYDVTFYNTLEDARSQVQVASYTRSEVVYLRVTAPPDATMTQIGNQSGPINLKSFVASSEPIKWTLNGFHDRTRVNVPTSATISVNFLRGRRPIPGNVYGTIGIDLAAPTVKAPAVSTAGGYPLLTGTVTDTGSGAAQVQATSTPKKPRKKFTKIKGKPGKKGTTKLKQKLRRVRSSHEARGAVDVIAGKPVYVRFKDAIGNVSDYCRVSGRTPRGGGPPRCKR
jgi:6-phosphogluconolactonase (cycloisomerase 2 family)